MKTIHDPRYVAMIAHLVKVRKDKKVNQSLLAGRLGIDRTHVSKVETLVRRIDFIELCDWLDALEYDREDFLREIGQLRRK